MASEVRSLPEAVYRAEWETLDPITRRFGTMAEVRAFVELVLSDDAWWHKTFPAGPFEVYVEERSSSARFAVAVNGNTIAIPNNPTGRTVATVLHELAHIGSTVHDHGPIFRTGMLKLVRRHMGFYAYAELDRAYRKNLAFPQI